MSRKLPIDCSLRYVSCLACNVKRPSQSSKQVPMCYLFECVCLCVSFTWYDKSHGTIASCSVCTGSTIVYVINTAGECMLAAGMCTEWGARLAWVSRAALCCFCCPQSAPMWTSCSSTVCKCSRATSCSTSPTSPTLQTVLQLRWGPHACLFTRVHACLVRLIRGGGFCLCTTDFFTCQGTLKETADLVLHTTQLPSPAQEALGFAS